MIHTMIVNPNNRPTKEHPYVKQLVEFTKHMDKTACDLMEELCNDKEYDAEKYDVEIKLAGKAVKLEFHADTFSRLEQLLMLETEEAKGMLKGIR